MPPDWPALTPTSRDRLLSRDLSAAVEEWLYTSFVGAWRNTWRGVPADAQLDIARAHANLNAARHAQVACDRHAADPRLNTWDRSQLRKRATATWRECQWILDDGLERRIGWFLADWRGTDIYSLLTDIGRLRPNRGAHVCQACATVHRPSRKRGIQQEPASSKLAPTGRSTHAAHCERCQRGKGYAPPVNAVPLRGVFRSSADVWWSPIHSAETGELEGWAKHRYADCKCCGRRIYDEDYKRIGRPREKCADCASGATEPIRFKRIDGTKNWTISIARPDGSSIHCRSTDAGLIEVSSREDARTLDSRPNLQRVA